MCLLCGLAESTDLPRPTTAGQQRVRAVGPGGYERVRSAGWSDDASRQILIVRCGTAIRVREMASRLPRWSRSGRAHRTRGVEAVGDLCPSRGRTDRAWSARIFNERAICDGRSFRSLRCGWDTACVRGAIGERTLLAQPAVGAGWGAALPLVRVSRAAAGYGCEECWLIALRAAPGTVRWVVAAPSISGSRSLGTPDAASLRAHRAGSRGQ